MTCRGSNGVGGEGGTHRAEISGAGNEAGTVAEKSGVAVGTEVGVGGRMGGRLVG